LFTSRRRHTSLVSDWSSDVCSSDLSLDDAQLVDLFAWSERDFLNRTEGSAIRRIGYDCWLRNIAIALGNVPTSKVVVAALNSRLNNVSEMVNEHIAWALQQHAS